MVEPAYGPCCKAVLKLCYRYRILGSHRLDQRSVKLIVLLGF